MRNTLLFVLVCIASGIVANAQDVEREMRQQFLFLPAFRDCGPAEVRGFGLGVHPRNALLAQLYVTSRSEKTIAAVKLGWKVYERERGGRIAAQPCEVNATPLQSGQGEFIDVQGLTKETIIIGTSPLPVSDPGKRVVFVSRPFLTVDDVRELFEREKDKHLRYMVILYLSEVQFQDGTKWAMPPPTP